MMDATMGRLLSRQLMTEWLGVTGLALLLLLAALFLFQGVRVAPVVLQVGLGFSDVLVLLALFIPAMLSLVFPLAVSVGLLATFARWQRDGEWTALLSLGVSKRRLLPPVFLVCLLGVFLQLGLGHWFAPRSLAAADARLEIFGAQAFRHMVRPGQFTAIGEEGLLYVHEITPDGVWRSPFWIVEADQSQSQLWAREARFDRPLYPTRLLLSDGGWRREGQSGAGWLRFDRMDLPLSELLRSFRRSDSLAAPWQMADARQLRATFLECEVADACGKAAGEFSRRNASGAALWLVGGLGLFLLGGSLLSRPTAAYALVAALVLAYHLLERLGMNLADKGLWSPFWGAWLPVFAGSGLLLLAVAGKRR